MSSFRKVFFSVPFLACLAVITLSGLRSNVTAKEVSAVQLFPIVQGGKWGYMDAKGSVVIKPTYDQAFDFSEGLAAVTKYPLRGYIDSTGKMIIKPAFTWTSRFREGRAIVISSKYFYGGNPNYYGRSFILGAIDKTGKPVKKMKSLRGGKSGFHDGMLVAYTSHKKHTKIYDLNMNEIKHDADQVCVFSGGVGAARKGKSWGYLDKAMKWVIEPAFDIAGDFSEGLAPVGKGKMDIRKGTTGNSKWGFIDKTGAIIIEQTFEDAWPFFDGLAAVKVGGKWGFIGKDGKMVIEPAYDYIWPFKEGLARVLKGSKQGFINKSGNVVIKIEYSNLWDFSKGLARVANDDHSEGYINKSGEWVWKPTK